MYICLRNTNNTKAIIESIKAFGLPVNVSEHSCLTFVEVETRDDILGAYAPLYSKCLRLYSREDGENAFEIPLSEIDVIYEL